MIPGEGEIRALHKRLAPDVAAFEQVHTHCEIVAEIAAGLLTPSLDPDLVRAGCLVHDIGVYRLDGAYIRHGIIGYELMRELGFSEGLSRFCAHHTGVGITRDDIVRQGLPLPPGDYVAETGEERLVMYADKFHSKTSPPAFVTAATYLREVSRFGPDKAAAFAAMVDEYGEPDLAPLAAAYGHALR